MQRTISDKVKLIALVLVAIIALIFALRPTLALAEPGDDITTGYDETEQALDQVKRNLAAAEAKLEELGHKVEEAGEDLAETEEALEKTVADIEQTEQEIAKKQDELVEAQEVLSKRLAANYKSGNLSFLNVILDSEDFNDFISRLHYVEKMNQQGAEAISVVKTIKAELQTKQEALDARRAEEQQLLEQQKAEKERLEQALSEQQAVYDNLGVEEKKLLEKRAKEIEEKKEAARQAAIEAARRAEAEAAARRAAEAAAAAAANSSSGSGSSSSSSSSGANNPNYTGTPSPDIVANAMTHLGKPYRWGGTGPNSYDCSGLSMTAYRMAGKNIPRTSRGQYAAAKAKGNVTKDMSKLVPGDLVWFARGGRVHHVGIYVGGGNMIHAPYTGTVIKIQPVNSTRGFIGGGRP